MALDSNQTPNSLLLQEAINDSYFGSYPHSAPQVRTALSIGILHFLQQTSYAG